MNELEKKLYPILEELEKKYAYAHLSPEEYETIVLSVIDQSPNVEQESSWKEKINQNILSYLCQKMQEEHSFSKVATSYLESIVTKEKSPLSEREIIESLAQFLKELKYPFTIEELFSLFQENTQVSKAITKFVEKNKTAIQNGQLSHILDDEYATSIMEAYCMETGKEIAENWTWDEDIPYQELDIETLYFRDINLPLLTMEEEQELGRRLLDKDPEARSMMIERNQKLVVSVASKKLGCGLEFLDLVQEGNIGLMTAVDRYDVRKGFRFSTYAMWWIKREISMAIMNQGRAIRLPKAVYQNLRKYQTTEEELTSKLSRTPTEEEMASALGMSRENLEQLRQMRALPVSLNMKVGNEEDMEIEELLSSEEPSPMDVVISSSLPSEVQQLLRDCHLSEREIDVINMRYGLNGEKEGMKLEQIGKLLHITKERARQIETEALIKIRRCVQIREFATYMDDESHAIQYVSTTAARSFRSTPIPISAYEEDYKNGKEEVNLVALKRYADQLDETKRKILYLRYGLDGGRKLGQTEIANQLGISVNTSYQILKRTLNHFYYTERRKKLAEKIEVYCETYGIPKGEKITKEQAEYMKQVFETETFQILVDKTDIDTAFATYLYLGGMDKTSFSIESIASWMKCSTEKIVTILNGVMEDDGKEFVELFGLTPITGKTKKKTKR